MVSRSYERHPVKTQQPAIVTWGLITINLIVFAIQLSAGDSHALAAAYGVTPAVVTRAIADTGPIPADATLLTSMFLHAGPEHLATNMIYLWLFGDGIEQALGPLRFLAFYLLSGVCAALVHVAFSAHSTSPLIGASGAIAGVLAAYLLLRPCAKLSVYLIVAVIRIRTGLVISFWALLQIIDLVDNVDDGVAYTGHVGGLLAGALLFIVMRPKGVELLECVDDEGEIASRE
jgi:rhomboid family protein